MNPGRPHLPRPLLALIVAAAWVLGAAAGAQAAAFVQIAPGLDQTCGVRGDGVAYCWGNGKQGQLGVIGESSARVPLKVIGSYQTAQMTSGQQYWCARMADGTAACTGLNSFGQLGDGNLSTADFAQDVIGLSNVSEISAGVTTTCAVDSARVFCWGDGSSGQLGDGVLQKQPQPNPTPVPGLPAAQWVDVGALSACAVLTTGQVRCWGDTADGKLGNGRTSVITAADTPVTGLTGAKTVAVGDRFACALRSDGTVWCWGDNTYGELGNGSNTGSRTPVQVAGLSGVVGLDAAGLTACAVTAGGSAWCWGDGRLGQVGGGTKGTFNAPVQVKGVPDAAQVGVSETTACLVSKSQVPACWGSNQYGQLGTGTPTGSGSGVAQPAFVIDSLQPAVLLPPNLAGLPVKTTKGGAVQFRQLKLTRTGKYCPEFVKVTVTAKHRSLVKRTKPNRLNGACELSTKVALAAHTAGASSASYSVRSSGSGGGIKTRKGRVQLLN